MPLPKTVRFAYAFALAFPLALAHPAESRGAPSGAGRSPTGDCGILQ